MPTTQNGYIRTIMNGNKVGPLMDISHYEQIKSFFLQLLDEQTPLPMNTLIGQGHERFKDVFKSETGWYLYHVKRDLEARGLITSLFPGRRHKTSEPNFQTSIAAVAPAHASDDCSLEVRKSVAEKFQELFGRRYLMAYAPGRINLMGEHTDYNKGFVLPAAINRGVHAAMWKSSHQTSLIYSMRHKEFLSVDLQNIHPDAPAAWGSYLLSIVRRLMELGYAPGPFNCVFDGDLPEGAGLSASASMQCAFAIALNQLFNLHLTDCKILAIVQWAEHHFAGVNSGITDHFACLKGRRDHAVRLDCATLDHAYIPLQLDGYCILVCDTNIKHVFSNSQYNHRKEECDKGLKIIRRHYPKITSLRDVTPETLASIRKKIPLHVYKRLRYVIGENARVLAAARNLQEGNLRAFGHKMYQTHHGLSALYEVSCPELDFLVDLAKGYPGVVGSRMMGGGFGASTITIIDSALVGAYVADAKKKFKEQFNRELSYYVVKTANGSRIISDKRGMFRQMADDETS